MEFHCTCWPLKFWCINIWCNLVRNAIPKWHQSIKNELYKSLQHSSLICFASFLNLQNLFNLKTKEYYQIGQTIEIVFHWYLLLKEKIVPPDPITSGEKKTVLQRLNQVIQYRLVSCELPHHMRKLKIGKYLELTSSALTEGDSSILKTDFICSNRRWFKYT